jgi:hypothetical protein
VSESQRQSRICWRGWHSGSKNVKVAIKADWSALAAPVQSVSRDGSPLTLPDCALEDGPQKTIPYFLY